MAGYTSVYVCLKVVEGLHEVSPEIGKDGEEENRNNFPVIQPFHCSHFPATRFLPLKSCKAEAAAGASELGEGS